MIEPTPLSSNSQNINPSLYLNSAKYLKGTDIRAIKVKPKEKAPLEKGWATDKNYPLDSPVILDNIRKGGNVGFTSVNGYSAFVDADIIEIQNVLEAEFSKTFRFSTGQPGHFQYIYGIVNGPIGNLPLNGGAYIKGRHGYAVGPGSVHPNGSVYGSREIRDVPVAFVKKSDLMGALAPFLLKKTQATNKKETPYERVEAVTLAQIKKTAEDLLPAWIKADHRRHALTLAIIGTCERSGWSKTDVKSLVDLLVKNSNKGHEHSTQVNYAYGRGSRKYGIPTLKQLLEATK